MEESQRIAVVLPPKVWLEVAKNEQTLVLMKAGNGFIAVLEPGGTKMTGESPENAIRNLEVMLMQSK